MAQLLQIAQLGNPVIRKKASPVKEVSSPGMQKLIDDLIATCFETDGVGIAAPQVCQSKAVFILASHPNPRYPNAPKMKPTAVINPKILAHSQTVEKDWEGCLSIPGLRGLVPRFTWVRVEYVTRQGTRVRKNYEGFAARIFQHEFDHLQGVVFLDRIESTKDIVTENEYRRIISKKVTKTSV